MSRSNLEVYQECNECGHQFNVADGAHCGTCFEKVQAERDDLEDEVSRLQDRIESLEDEIKQLKNAIGNCSGTCQAELTIKKL